ncbi:hypothetical protein GR210_12430 [Rhizobium leguminosarum]|uniref:hypothetical protein n=1 Tax=Rhizobium leguminosarum TaxID=384 RepID=UPI0013DD8479|nr:hypothetical protein [Rhizobium leguminosarum]NEH49589.1 hypothetical protein [Rhizobium leguminosarum]
MTRAIQGACNCRASTILIILAFLLFFYAEASATPQRMLLLPTNGFITIGKGGGGKLPAMCLDAHRSSPELGDRFTRAPSVLGSATVSIGGTAPIPLQQAIDQKAIELQGNGFYESVDVVNMTGQPLSIQVPTTSVLAPAKAPDTDDLAGLPLIGKPDAFFSQNELWESSTNTQLERRGWQAAEVAGLTARGVEPTDILQLLDEGSTKSDIVSYGFDAKVVSKLQGLGWNDDDIKSFAGKLSFVDALVEAKWTKAEISAVSGDMATIADLADAGWSSADVRDLKVDPSDALRLVYTGWSLGQINSIKSHVKAATILAERGLSHEQVLGLGQQLGGSANLAEWTSGHGTNAAGGLRFSLQRISNGVSSTYLLFSPVGGILSVIGNRSLDEVGTRIRTLMMFTDQDGPPEIILVGDGTQGDFDAAQMTVLSADAGGGGDKVPIVFTKTPDDFPPNGGGGKWNSSEGPVPYVQMVIGDSGKRSKTIPFLNRGDVKISVSAILIARWYSVLSAMHVGVNDAKADPGIDSMSRVDVETAIDKHIRLRIEQEKQDSNSPGLFSPDAVKAEFNLDKALTVKQYVENSLPPLIRFAAREGLQQ